MKKKRKIGYEIKKLHNQFLRVLIEIQSQLDEMDDVTGLQGWVIGFLFHEGKDKDIFQKDIETECNIRGSTATSLLKRMEKKGFIEREKLSEDARWKRILLTPKAKKICAQAEVAFTALEKRMASGIDKNELEIFYKVVDKVYSNLSD